MKQIAGIVGNLWRRFDSADKRDFYNHCLVILFNVQQIWLYFEFPGKSSLFVACLGAWSLFFAWQLLNRNSRIAAIGASLISISAIVMVIFSFASIYERYGILGTPGARETHDPLICLYFSMVTITTLGYGDFVPSPPARLFAGSEALAGLFLIAALIAVFARVFDRLTGSNKDATQ